MPNQTEMLSLKELGEASIDLDVAREAYDHATARLSDVLDAKRTFELKAQALFGGYVALALALFSGAGAFARDGHPDSQFVAGLAVSGLVFLIGALFSTLALRDRMYGGLGSAPKQWLFDGGINSSPGGLGKLLAYLTFHRQGEIDDSLKHNAEKALWIKRTIWCGWLAPAVLGFCLLF